jgi:F-type H+-transporting ATPase subunit gamma
MSGLKQLKLRITGVKATRKVTKAMQLVAASKLRRAQEAADMARPYAGAINRVMGNLQTALGDDAAQLPLLCGHILPAQQKQTHLLIVLTADRGLCGGFNAQVLRAVRAEATKREQQGHNVRFLCVGRKGYEALVRLYPQQVEPLISYKSLKRIGYAQAHEVAQQVLQGFNLQKYHQCALVYARFINVLLQTPTVAQLLPLPANADAAPTDATLVYDFEPNPQRLLADLLPRAVTAKVFSAMLDAVAGEQAARMSAMDNASRNADRMVKSLTLRYNRTRQANITRELIEIISGAEAL